MTMGSFGPTSSSTSGGSPANEGVLATVRARALAVAKPKKQFRVSECIVSLLWRLAQDNLEPEEIFADFFN